MKNFSMGAFPKSHLWMDMFLLNISFLLAYQIRFGDLSYGFYSHYFSLIQICNLMWLLTTFGLNTYHFTRLSFNFNDQVGNFLKAAFVHVFFIIAFLYLSKKAEDHSRIQLTISYGLFIASATAGRAALLLVLRLYRQAGYNIQRYAVIGKDELTELIEGFHKEHPELGYKYSGMFDFRSHEDDEKALETFIKTQQLDYLYCCLSKLSDEQVRKIIRVSERQHTQVKLVPDFRGFMTNLATIEYHDIYPIIGVSTKPFSNVREQNIKRAFDLAFSLLVMLAGAPVFLLVMLAVKLTSSGPVFFLQSRTGQGGKTFKIFKFRTMVVDAEKFGLQHSQGKKDPRLTPIGAFLRQTRLDELPQFLNVIRGEMSIVGPRPLPFYDVEMLMNAAPQDFQKLLTVKPGITSIGQIKVGYATNVAENVNRLKYDLEYLGKYSLRQDISLVFQTVMVMALGRGR